MVITFETKDYIIGRRLTDPRHTARCEYSIKQASKDFAREMQETNHFSHIMDLFCGVAKQFPYSERLPLYLDDLTEVLDEAIRNAGVHGNWNLPTCKVLVTTYHGDNGAVTFVEDEGCGFDVTRFLRRRRHEKPKRGIQHGLDLFERSPVSVAYHGNGSIVSIATPLPEPYDCYSL